MKRIFKLTALTLAIFANHYALANDIEAISSEEVKNTSQYKIQLYQVPYNVLGVNPTDPRYNQNANMYFALNEVGYYPLMDMLISSEKRNPFTATQILGGFAYVNKWEVNDKNNLTILNQQVGLDILPDNATFEEMLFAKLAVDKHYLVGWYYSSKLLNEWKNSKPKEGLERIYSNYTKLDKYFGHEFELNVSSKIDKPIYEKVYRDAVKSLPPNLLGNIDVQFYLNSLFLKDELVRQLTEVSLLNTLSPEELGQISFAADLLIKNMQAEKIPPLLNGYYGQKIERNNNVKFDQVDYSGFYERVYHSDEKLGASLGINRLIEIKPSNKISKGYQFTIYNADEPLNLIAQFNPNGRGLDVFEELDYYVEYTPDRKYLIMYANPSEGDSVRFIFQKTNQKTPYKQLNDVINLNLSSKDTLPSNLPRSNAGPKSVLLAWSDVVGNKFNIDASETQNAAWSWKTQEIYGLKPALTSCDLGNLEPCIDGLRNVSVFVNGFKNDYKILNSCDVFNDKGLSSRKIDLAYNIKGRLWLSSEKDKSENYNNMLSFKLPVLNNDKKEEVCVATYFYPNETSINHSLQFSNKLINRMVKGE